jgi:hypothetical protein
MPARSIQPGKPYVFEWRSTVSTQIDNPEFTDVTIKTSEAAEMTVSSTDGTVQFVGTYAPQMLVGRTTANLYMGQDDKLEFPMSNMAINAFYAYFLVDLGNGPGEPGSTEVRKIVMNIAGESGVTTRVIEIPVSASAHDDTWYDLQGRKYTDLPNAHGIFIKNGRKVVIK